MPQPDAAAPPSGAAATLSIALPIAAAALGAVRAGRALDDALVVASASAPPAERAAAQDIAYTACRRLNLLDALAATLLSKPNLALDALLRVALSQLIDQPDRAHVIVNEAVKAIAAVRGGVFKPVLNAVLRRFLRERDALLAQANLAEEVRLGYPAWWIARARAAWPDHAIELLAEGNRRAPMTLRVNRRRGDVATCLADLASQGVAASIVGSDAIRLARPQPARSLPGFAAGLLSIQDLGAQQAAGLLAPQDGMRVLDACAAPGGKTAHLLEYADCDLLALDRDAVRLRAVGANLERLGLAAELKCADAAAVDTWWDGRGFDRILLDAPCTASGVIRRHPDGKWLKREGDIAALARVQARLLAALWQVLRPGGKLLYATCSVFPDENSSQTAGFLTAYPDAKQLPIDLPVAHHDGQLLPDSIHDGFYYALFEKAS